MAQPSQVFPPWLSPTPVVITNAAGAPVATETSIEYIAPTYFGPSIPLGTLYSFGGTSEPPTVFLPGQTTLSAVATSITTTAAPTTTALTTPSATPSTSTSVSSISISTSSATSAITSSTTSAITSSTSASSSLSQSASLTSSSTVSASSTGAVAHVGGSSLSKGQLVGVIVASILAVIVSFVAVITLWLCLKGRRKRRSQFNTLPIDDDYEVIPPGGRLPGDGSPRHSGEEFDPFLQRHSGAPSGEAAEAAAAAAVGAAGGAALAGPSRAPRVPPPPVGTAGSKSSGSTANTGSGSSNSNASGFGVLLDRPSLGFLPITPEHDETGGQPLSPTDMARIQRESVLPDDENQYDENGEYTGAYAISQDPQAAPPRLVEPSASTPLLGGVGDNPRTPFMTQPSYLSEKSSVGSQEEGETSILTARRVKAEDLGPRTNSDSSAGPSHRASTGLLGALGLSGLANIGRLSWFKNLDSPRNSRAIATPDYTSDPLTEKDIETGRSAMASSPRQADSFGTRLRPGAGVGTLPDGSRPISNVSARSGASGGTLYHDAHSSLPGTPLLAPLPRALTPAEQPQPPTTERAWISNALNVGVSGSPPPPAYTDRPLPTSSTPPPQHPSSEGSTALPTDDILDIPAPAALDHFSSISSLKDTPTGSSFGNNSTKPSPFPPPGLESTIRPIGWSSGDTATTASRGSFAGLFGLSSTISGMMGMGGHHDAHDVSISVDDVLDEAPPDAEQGWRTISSAGSHSHGHASLGAVGGGMGASDPGRRGTFGLYVPHNPSINSEQGSLHSMRSHFSPAASTRSSGSAPASRPDREIRKDGSISSNSSRPSAHSVARSMGSGVSVTAHSLFRTGSISEDERRRGPISPALSAFGHHQQRTSSSGEQEQQHPRQPSSPLAMVATIGSPPTAYMSPDKVTSNTVRVMNSAGSAGSTMLADTSFGTSDTLRPRYARDGEDEGEDVGLLSPARSMSPPISVSNAPWAGGLDGDWQPAP